MTGQPLSANHYAESLAESCVTCNIGHLTSGDAIPKIDPHSLVVLQE